MLSKLLLTALVIAVAIALMRRENIRNRESSPQNAANAETAAASSTHADLRAAAYLFLILMFGIGALLYYQRWQDDHHLLTVTLFRDGAAPPVSYQVYRFQLQDRSFITVDGVRINVADNERMEVTGLE